VERNQFDVYWVEEPQMKVQLIVNQNELFLRAVARVQQLREVALFFRNQMAQVEMKFRLPLD
jgi:hypothetical protein